MVEALDAHGGLSVALRALNPADAPNVAAVSRCFRDALYEFWGAPGTRRRMEWLRSLGSAAPLWLAAWDDETTRTLARNGLRSALAWVQGHGLPLTAACGAAAARGCHLETLQWLAAHGCPLDSATSKWAARRGCVRILAWAESTGISLCGVSHAAAAHGQFGVLEWAHKVDVLNGPTVYVAGAQNGRLDVVHWAWRKGCKLTRRTFTAYAAQGGSLAVLRWGVYNGCALTTEALEAAASAGHCDVVKYLCEKHCPRSATACAEAASSGAHAALWLLRWYGVPWDESTMHGAARHGDCSLLAELVQRGCPGSHLSPVVAASAGHFDAMWFLLAHGFQPTPLLAATAAQNGNLQVLMELRVIGCPWDENCTYQAAATGSLRVLKWSVMRGCPWYTTACLRAAQTGGHVATEAWIQEVTNA